ncbi:hypothetical protein GF420_06120 [candidate division GN15 bacterium]|nr:hypothetical protein [candidate division GN15 bacterium]
MVYKFSYPDGVMEFAQNHGRAVVEAADADAAVEKLRGMFASIREESVASIGEDQFLVTFKVSLDYRLNLVRQVEKSLRYVRDFNTYRTSRYLDRYILAHLFKETGRPGWLDEIEDIKREISQLRKAAVVARELAKIEHFVDWDIAIYNFIELNTKEGHRSRVVRHR